MGCADTVGDGTAIFGAIEITIPALMVCSSGTAAYAPQLAPAKQRVCSRASSIRPGDFPTRKRLWNFGPFSAFLTIPKAVESRMIRDPEHHVGDAAAS